ncbi:flagellar hook-associated protein FlgL [Paeniglutamicibacter psychrophenolicus]|uniref:flagellar hook-associated protein FlgL n=1 Tax=Paeniglutamicibacter psychrophenolicus TaxID=257454 RepID=UPI00277E5D8E|nr:flagellar hook-associated protein FlgL [Paeniglutamicibacter psychrophenolicus]MDQ0094655.1 flagellar hook-associated protein 3 FlgL [Paeniglutamicibacter psychrophenolicus]
MTRITTASLSLNTERNLQAAMTRLASIQNKAGTQQEIGRPSDDPAGTANAMAVRAEQRQNEQFSRNVQDANGWLSTTDNALTTATDLLQQARDLAVKGANDGALTPQAKEALALELDQLHDALLSTANTKFMGRHVFAGTSNGSTAVDTENGAYAFSGTSGVERRIGQNSTVRVDANGADVFGQGATSVFQLVKDIAMNLRDGTNISSRIGDIDERLQDVLGAQAAIGASHASVLAADGALLSDAVSLEARRSGIEDIDLGSVILELKTQEVAYQAALSAAARTLQPSLMDFLR